MDTLIDIFIIIFYPLIVFLNDIFRELGKCLLELLEMYEKFITYISEKIFRKSDFS